MQHNDVDKLIADNKKLIELEAAKYATNLPLITVQIEAYKLAREAARTYDPSSGFKFSTHLVNSLKKLSRMSTQYGSVVRLPENTQFGINKLNKLEKDLADKLGREATVEELAHHSGFSQRIVNNMLSSRRTVANMATMFDTPVMFDSTNDEWVAFVYHDLGDKDKIIFEHKTGFGGKKILDNTSIAKKIGLSPSVLNNRIRIINDMLAKGWK